MATSPLAWVTGAGGLIGNYLVQLAPSLAPGWQVRGLRRADVDLADFAALRRVFQQDRPQLIIHCAALSRSPDCEANPAQARLLNVEVTQRLAEWGAEVPFVWFSTDLVFDGRQGPYTEAATPNPLSVYAETKHLAEQAVLGHPRALVIRTSLNGGTSPTGDRGFNEQMRRAWGAGQCLRLFTDEFRSPIPARATARAVWELVHSGARGIYHVAGAERLSRWEIGRLVAARCPELTPRLEAASLREYAGAPRPPDTSLDCAKAQQRLSFPLPGLRSWLTAHPEIPF
jgi:dTDP-4-dehydrorhamnose reductase